MALGLSLCRGNQSHVHMLCMPRALTAVGIVLCTLLAPVGHTLVCRCGPRSVRRRGGGTARSGTPAASCTTSSCPSTCCLRRYGHARAASLHHFPFPFPWGPLPICRRLNCDVAVAGTTSSLLLCRACAGQEVGQDCRRGLPEAHHCPGVQASKVHSQHRCGLGLPPPPFAFAFAFALPSCLPSRFSIPAPPFSVYDSSATTLWRLVGGYRALDSCKPSVLDHGGVDSVSLVCVRMLVGSQAPRPLSACGRRCRSLYDCPTGTPAAAPRRPRQPPPCSRPP
jgi:hypothetical protein